MYGIVGYATVSYHLVVGNVATRWLRWAMMDRVISTTRDHYQRKIVASGRPTNDRYR